MENVKKWTEVDAYITRKLLPVDSILEGVLEANAKAGLPAIDVAPNHAKFLHLIALIQGAKRILEIGTLGGYSTIWMARALPADGRLITLESEVHHAEVAKSNIARAGLSDLVEVRIGPALETLPKLNDEGVCPFDLIFIDADKQNNSEYLNWALKLSRKGTVIIGDNVVRKGEVVNASSTDSSVQGVRSFFDALASEPQLSSTAIQTVGSKGYDGFAISIVL
ncbi:O-methyltransferase [Bacillus gaemokensis]|uniref:Methyltransferase n=1 Tax=Bacillus gaemokensis TaxID=574375 RepID=A0A073K570_9BACI|nr:O-methyltransferase [Bacillus gaemokensis]KEK21705.1 methyltransferase [Bacillus gaemokensis]KYG38478.1 methyltransferase [Bacillus gaemokensis]